MSSSLIIGGSGFVGRNLDQHLTDRGESVFVLDRTYRKGGAPDSTFIQGDASDGKLLTELLNDTKPDCLYHLAANSDISAGVKDPSLDFTDTLMTTVAVCEAVKRSPVREIVFASSSAIFGNQSDPISESPDFVPTPASWYGKAKLASEYVLESLALSLPMMKLNIFRFPNVVGPLATHGVVFDFVSKLRQDPSALPVLGNGHQTKPYVHVSELLNTITYCRQASIAGINKVNVGPIDTLSVREIVKEVISALGLDPSVSFEDSSVGWQGDVPRYEFDTSLMRMMGCPIEMTSREAVRRAAFELALELPAQ